MIIFYTIVICAFPLILMCINAYLECKKIDCLPDEKKTDDARVSGFRRSIIALTLIIIIGIALLHLIAGGKDGGMTGGVPGGLVGNIISMLTGVVASIAGFYFGGKAALDPSNEPAYNNGRNRNNKKKSIVQFFKR